MLKAAYRRFHSSISCEKVANIGMCPGQGNISPHLFTLIQYELSSSPENIINILEEVRPIIPDSRMYSFFDPIKSPFLFQNHPNMELLKLTSFVQPLLLLTTFFNYKLVNQYSNWDVRNSNYLLGHSLGELSSFVVQDVLSLESGLIIAAERGRLMEQAVEQNGNGEKWGMAALLFHESNFRSVTNLCSKLSLNIATVNGLNQIVVSGKIEELRTKTQKLNNIRKNLGQLKAWKGGMKIVWLKTEVPVHHPIFKSIEPELRKVVFEEFEKSGSRDLKVPIVSNIDGSIISKSSSRALENFVKLTSKAVQFKDCLETIQGLRKIEPDLELNFVSVSDVTNTLVNKYFKGIGVEVNSYNLIEETLESLS